MYDNKCTLEARTVTYEGVEIYSKREPIKNKGPVFEILSKAMW